MLAPRFHVRHKSGSEFRRARDFLRREPEFIGAYARSEAIKVLYDIGANIGPFRCSARNSTRNSRFLL